MGQKIIWMLLLAIGILNSTSCSKKVDNSYIEEYVYTNNSDYKITIESYTKLGEDFHRSTYSILKDSTLRQKIELTFGSKTGIVALSDSVVVIYDNARKKSFLPMTESSFNILNHENYSIVSNSDNYILYSYYFSESDFEEAESIE